MKLWSKSPSNPFRSLITAPVSASLCGLVVHVTSLWRLLPLDYRCDEVWTLLCRNLKLSILNINFCRIRVMNRRKHCMNLVLILASMWCSRLVISIIVNNLFSTVPFAIRYRGAKYRSCLVVVLFLGSYKNILNLHFFTSWPMWYCNICVICNVSLVNSISAL